MATLQSYTLSLEFNFLEYDDCGWVQYEINFKINGQNIADNSRLKRHNEHWANRPNNGFKANEYRGDTFIPTLEEVLTTNNADYWQPTEPDIIIAIYPEQSFPFLESHIKRRWEKPELRAAREERNRLKKELGVLPDDLIQIICMVNTYNFGGEYAYSDDGIALIMTVQRHTLEEFLMNLKKEYQEFETKYKEMIEHFKRYNEE